MSGMLVSTRSARKCCAYCDSDFGKSACSKDKAKLKRKIRRRDNSRKDWLKGY